MLCLGDCKFRELWGVGFVRVSIVFWGLLCDSKGLCIAAYGRVCNVYDTLDVT